MNIKTLSDYDFLELTINENKITSYLDIFTGGSMKGFHQRLTIKIPKLYIIKENLEYLYIGTTIQSITSRLRYGLNANGKGGYHGYKWKTKEKVILYVWRFEELDMHQVENIEAELAYLIRQKTGKWPINQNEIHFNNDYDDGKVLAFELYKATQQNFRK